MLVNLTPHDVTLIDNGKRITLKPSGTIARCRALTEIVGSITDENGEIWPETRTVYGAVEDLPEPMDGVTYIVSSLVALAMPQRHDLRIPNESVRDVDGKIIGCKSLGRVDQC